MRYQLIVGYVVLIMLVASWTQALFSATEQPDALVESATKEVLAVIKTTTDQRKLVQVAESKIVQDFDFQRMTKLAVGKGWRKATPEQQDALVQQFKDLLVHTYANALASGAHRNASFKMMPFHMAAGDTDVAVATQITESGKAPVEIDYRLENTPAGWKVYDVIVDNVSLVMTYRGSFAEAIDKSGVDGLIKQLTDKNRTLASDGGGKAGQ